MDARELDSEIRRVYEDELRPLLRRLQERRPAIQAEAKRTRSRAGFAELNALRRQIGDVDDRIVELRRRRHATVGTGGV